MFQPRNVIVFFDVVVLIYRIFSVPSTSSHKLPLEFLICFDEIPENFFFFLGNRFSAACTSVDKSQGKDAGERDWIPVPYTLINITIKFQEQGRVIRVAGGRERGKFRNFNNNIPQCCTIVSFIISCLRKFLLFSQVYSQLIYLIKFIFTNRTSVDVKPGLISSKQTWFDVNGLGEQKKFTQTWYYKGIP